MSPCSLAGWVPVSAALQDGELVFELCALGPQRLLEPFFDDSLTRAMRLPLHGLLRRRLSVAQALEALSEEPGLPPAGFIFHLSRCGSTLVSQLLAGSSAHRVISEAMPIDRALRQPSGEAASAAALRAAIGLLGQPAVDSERRLYIKFDSWHCAWLPLIRSLYPEVPWLLLTRDPLEILASQLRQPGVQMVPGMLGYAPPGVEAGEAWRLPREEYGARMLGALAEAACLAWQQDAGRGLLLDYRELRSALASRVWPHLGWQPDPQEQQVIAERLLRDAKNPQLPFEPKPQHVELTGAAREAVLRWAAPAYQRLLALGATR
jgi:hypothetical protein